MTMNQLIGVRSPVEVFNEPIIEDMFKKEALLFQSIAIPHLTCLLSERGCSSDSPRLSPEIANHLEWLLERAVVIPCPGDHTPHSDENSEERALLVHKKEELESLLEPVIDARTELAAKLDSVTKRLQETVRMLGAREPKRTQPIDQQMMRNPSDDTGSLWESITASAHRIIEHEKQLLKARLVYGQFLARISTIDLRNAGLEAYPVFYSDPVPLTQVPTEKQGVLQIVLEALPTPDDSTSWEQILDYRNDPESQGKFLALKHWMNEVVRVELNPREIQDKIDHLIHDYEQHMRRHELKIYPGILQTFVVGSAEILENAMKLKLKDLAKGLFFIRNRQLELMEAEAAAPGREIAYIVQAKRTF